MGVSPSIKYLESESDPGKKPHYDKNLGVCFIVVEVLKVSSKETTEVRGGLGHLCV